MGQIVYAASDLVGMQSRLEEVEKLLDLGSDDVVRVVGLCGMGGIGKSTLAKVLYNRISHYFDAFCFLDHVGELLKRDDQSLQKLLRDNLGTKDPEISYMLKGRFLAHTSLRHHKFLIVLDGVDILQNLEALNLGKRSNWFGGGSRIIITTRAERILQASEVDDIYKLELLTKDEALQLFCKIAFRHDYPMRGYEELTDNVLEYADGFLLAIVILGSFLRARTIPEWKSALAKLRGTPPHVIVEVLRKGFDELDIMDKEIFLDIACFFIGKEINCVKENLHNCGFSAEVGIKLLIEKSLMTILNQRIQMHRLL